jgi:hypothetical protein
MRILAVVLVAACGGAAVVPAQPTGPTEPTEPAAPLGPDCFRVMDHLDAVLGPAFATGPGAPVFGPEPRTHSSIATVCAGLPIWTRACVVFATTPAEVDACDPGNAPGFRGYAGPSDYQRQKFEECVARARDRDELGQCSYYEDAEGLVPRYPAERP